MVSSSSSVEAELEKILKSKWLRESHQLSALLSRVVEETLAGRTDGLKEYSLGLEVFRRPKNYDPRNDAIVRVQASLLRKRLAAYYENEGKDSALNIEIPRGAYVAKFRVCEPDLADEVAVAPRRKRAWPIFVGGLAAGGFIVAVGLVLWNRPAAVEGRAIWGDILKPGVDAVASFGVPLFYIGGLGLYVRDVQVNTLDEEHKGRIPWIGEKLQMNFRPQEDVYTGVGDAIGTHLVARWLETHGVKVVVANSNYIGPSDIEGKNLIVVASARFQTMLQGMNLATRYHFNLRGMSGGYSVDSPLPGEAAFYGPSTGLGVNIDYGVMSLWPGKKEGTRILYLSGTNTWTTQGVAQFAIDRAQMANLQRRLDADAVDGPRGKKSPYLQVLVQVEGKNNRLRSANYVSHRYLSQADGR